jgi:hypothetical protein
MPQKLVTHCDECGNEYDYKGVAPTFQDDEEIFFCGSVCFCRYAARAYANSQANKIGLNIKLHRPHLEVKKGDL